MLGPLVYILILLGVILAGGFALNFLVRGDGEVVLRYGDRVYDVTLFEAAIMLVLMILAIMVALWVLRIAIALVRFIAGDETAFSRFFARSRERRGLDALSGAYLALAAGDGKQAQRKAERAEQKLMRPELTRIINAQAAEMAGDEPRARTYYRALLMDSSTAFVGARGLLKLALKNGDHDRALKLAEHARELNPKDAEVLETLYMLQSQAFDWSAARRTLTAQAKAGHLPSPEAHRREAALALAQAEDASGMGDTEQSRALAVEAAKLDPTNATAVTTAVRLLLDQGAKRAATKLVTDAWRVHPRAQLGAAFASVEPDEAPAARRRRFETLFAMHPEHSETRFLRAELALVDGDWTGAQAAIGELRETEPSARSCAIMAAIARGRGEPEHVVRAWLARALGAPRDEAAEVAISHAAMLPLLLEIDTPRRAAAPGPGPAPAAGSPGTAATGTGTTTGTGADGSGRPAEAVTGAQVDRPAAEPEPDEETAEITAIPPEHADIEDAEEIAPPRRDLEGAEDTGRASSRKPAA